MENNITKENHNDDEIDEEINNIIDKVEIYLTIVIIICGIVGNLISLLIFTRPNLNKKTNTGILYTLLCIFNILIFINEAFLGIYSYDFFHYNFTIVLFTSKIYLKELITTSLTEILHWIQVLICFDRFILVIYPMKAHVMRKKVFFNNYIYI